MSDSAGHPTMQDIADRVGVSRSAVSLALRNHPSIPEATRQRVRQAAEELGYRRNPLVAALMTQLRQPRHRATATIALITKFPRPIRTRPVPDFYHILGEAVYRSAEAQGFAVDEFMADDPSMTGPRLTRILVSRGIHGIILFPGSISRDDYLELEWERFATVLIGYGLRSHVFHQVASDYLYDMDMAWNRLREYGYRRIGYAVPAGVDRSTDRTWLARYLVNQQVLPVRDRLRPLPIPGADIEPEALVQWVRKNRPDCLIVNTPAVRDILEKAGWRIPRDLGLLNLTQRTRDGMSGVDPNTGEVGTTAVETLALHLQANQRGVPRVPHLVLVKGLWVEGDTLRKL